LAGRRQADRLREGTRIDYGAMLHYNVRDGIADPRRVVQVGIRSRFHGDETYGMTVLFADQVHAMPAEEAAAMIRRVLADGSSCLTFDIDCHDPAPAPGRGTAVPGGPYLASGAVDPARDEGDGFQGDGHGRGLPIL